MSSSAVMALPQLHSAGPTKKTTDLYFNSHLPSSSSSRTMIGPPPSNYDPNTVAHIQTELEAEHAQRSYQQWWNNYDHQQHQQQFTGPTNVHSLPSQNHSFTFTNSSYNPYTAFPNSNSNSTFYNTPPPNAWGNDATLFSTPASHSQASHSSGSTGWPDEPLYNNPPAPINNVPVLSVSPPLPPSASSSPSLGQLQQQQQQPQTHYFDLGHGAPQRQPQPTSQPQTRKARRSTPNASSPAAATSTSTSRTTANKRKRGGATRKSPTQDKRVRISNANASDSDSEDDDDYDFGISVGVGGLTGRSSGANGKGKSRL
ncbi:hypothetical protein D9758_010417 [Tetrapyrgos nigripes]|uniref:Uncharacterized protein n=1 Tax=Tetrapyrgos nigripes TaxID=182062 RepID=A0A8H5FQG6_9AGAR|nr:hypothetical protein D9758_010417 [Tetrapyrgos nigripes]